MPKRREYDIKELNHYLGTKMAKNVTDLANVYGVTKSSLYSWLKRNGYVLKNYKRIVKRNE